MDWCRLPHLKFQNTLEVKCLPLLISAAKLLYEEALRKSKLNHLDFCHKIYSVKIYSCLIVIVVRHDNCKYSFSLTGYTTQKRTSPKGNIFCKGTICVRIEVQIILQQSTTQTSINARGLFYLI